MQVSLLYVDLHTFAYMRERFFRVIR
jgi:hypothetical protein